MSDARRDGSRTPHKNDEQAEARLRLFVECVKDYAIFMLDTAGYVASWNVGARRIKGYEEEEIVGKHFSIFYPREDIEAGKCEYELEVASREGRFEDEGFRLRKDGSKFWANVVITAIRDHAGRLVGFGKVTRDLTARREAEQQSIRSARVEEADRRKDDFLAILGHELRNPLASMANAAQIIKRRQGIGCDDEVVILDRQLTHLTRLLDDLTDVSRTLRDKVILSPKVLGIEEVLRNAADMSAALVAEKKHRFTVDVADPAPNVDVDPERITQVFVNLFNNAAKYTDRGGEIRVRAVGRDDFVEVTVQDDGIGISPDFMERLFDLFTQAKEGTERQLGGLGVGLAVAKRLVEEHGGRITAESDGIGRGSTFTVFLPRAVATASRSTDCPSAPPPSSARRRRVLVVDDNHDYAELTRKLLGQLGHEVAAAADGWSGLELAAEFRPDVVLLDLGLPGMSGFDVCRRLRKLPACATIPIIAVSGYARAVDRKNALEAGFSGHVAKPFDVAELVEHLA